MLKNDGDIEKKIDTVKDKKILYFGNKVIISGNKKIKDNVYVSVQLPDKSKYWIELDYLVLKFITILQKDLSCYNQPDDGYMNKTKLQPGYFAYYQKEQDGWINIEMASYLPGKTKSDKAIWLGNVWIKKDTGYSENIATANQAVFLSRAFNEFYNKKNTMNALKQLEDGLALTNSNDSEIKSILEDLKASIKSDTGTTTTTVTSDTGKSGKEIYYTPTITNLRFRETTGAEGKVIRILNQNEKLLLLETGASETINGIKGNWCKFKSETGEIGWCFTGYLTIIQ
jgi:hypothetical protein